MYFDVFCYCFDDLLQLVRVENHALCFAFVYVGFLPKLTFYGNRLGREWQNWTRARCARASGAGRRQGAQTVLSLTSKSFCLGPVPV